MKINFINVPRKNKGTAHTVIKKTPTYTETEYFWVGTEHL